VHYAESSTDVVQSIVEKSVSFQHQNAITAAGVSPCTSSSGRTGSSADSGVSTLDSASAGLLLSLLLCVPCLVCVCSNFVLIAIRWLLAVYFVLIGAFCREQYRRCKVERREARVRSTPEHSHDACSVLAHFQQRKDRFVG
jgi:hypothetical protein